jgi:predicted small metal-binding protein
MGFFGKKQEGATAATVAKKDGWIVQCAPLCGFELKDHDKNEAALMTQMHMKNTHKTNLTMAEATESVKPYKF